LLVEPDDPCVTHEHDWHLEISGPCEEFLFRRRIAPNVPFHERDAAVREEITYVAALLSGGCRVVGIERVEHHLVSRHVEPPFYWINQPPSTNTMDPVI
jgi:hypothetical protein